MTFDTMLEILSLIRRNKLRTALTALSVAWGIFMLVLLLAAGTGLQHGVEYDFRDDAANSIWLRGGEVSLAHKGNAPGRRIEFTNADLDAIAREVPGVEHITGRFYLWGGFEVSRGDRHAAFDIRGCHPDHLYLEKTILLAGRFINEIDIRKRRKIAVIGPEVERALFPGENPLGQYISIRGVNYKVVGLYKDEGGQNELRKIYIPISTAQLVYRGHDRVHRIMFTVGDADLEQSERIADMTRTLMARRHRFSPADRRALHVQNNLARFQRVTDIFSYVRVFVWLVGIGTIFAGIVGVSNIMLISVKERTFEIGIRKAVGATPRSILAMILLEALLITGVSGYAGLTTGVLVVELVNRFVPENEYLRDPQVNVQIALIATVVLVLAGVLAGLIPGFRAARVKPVVAMRAE